MEKIYQLNDMDAVYSINEEGICSFIILPHSIEKPGNIKKDANPENLVQIKYAGDIYSEAYSGGVSMRNGQSTRELKYVDQKIIHISDGTVISTFLQDPRGYEVTHVLYHRDGDKYVRMHNVFKNKSKECVSLEMISSFSLGGITPFIEGDAYETLDLYRIRSVWSGEGRLSVDSFEDLCLETAWGHHAVRAERYGQSGSMPVNKFFPMGAIYDKKKKIFWGAQVAHNSAWQIEIYRKDEGVGFSGGLADREFGHWLKNIRPGESFITPEALVSTMDASGMELDARFATSQAGVFDIFMQRMTAEGKRNILKAPASEKKLPVMFNEFCTTWGNPSHENIVKIVDAIRGRGFKYFVIDCGWYKKEGIPWDKCMGDYEISESLFPEGLQKTVDYIKAAGLVPGIWFEIDNVASEAKVYKLTDHLLKRDGKPLTSYFRRFWDLNDPWVETYLTDKVIGTLKRYGFGYLKMDYNETIGIGTDGSESLGEGLRVNSRASIRFIEKIKQEIPGIILENCASGGHRMEPEMMEECAMASFSDAHECLEIPVIAAYLHRVIHPAQSQIWAVIREADSMQRIVYSMANTLLGRMCVSGDVASLTQIQWQAIDDAIAFYKKSTDIILNGESVLYGPKQKSMRHPKGYQAVIRSTADRELIVIHSFENESPVTVCLPTGGKNIEAYYGEKCNQNKAEITAGKFELTLDKSFEAVAFIVDK